MELTKKDKIKKLLLQGRSLTPLDAQLAIGVLSTTFNRCIDELRDFYPIESERVYTSNAVVKRHWISKDWLKANAVKHMELAI